MILPSGERIERLPAWIKRVTQDLSVSPVYDARFWNPPADQKYNFKHSRPPKVTSARIYEAHVGISTPEPRVGTYKEFTQNTLPRIKALGYNVIQLMAIMEHAYYACEFIFADATGIHQYLIVVSIRISGYELLCCELSVWNTRGTQRTSRHCSFHGHYGSSRCRTLPCVQERARWAEPV